ncbi:MAG: TonB-dependent receptor [Bacteroidales bacterium]|nr:TonB-dependent receptor [Bacteroidales bacterium]
MKKILFIAVVLSGITANAQDTTDVFSRHLQLNSVIVTGLTGDSKISETPSPVSVIDPEALRRGAFSNIIQFISREPGVSQISTGGGIAKPVIRGLGYNRVVVFADGIRQEGQQWGDEHGVEIDGSGVHSAEIIKGPASLMYGSDALAGVIILNPDLNLAPGSFAANLSSEYQSNSGLALYSLYHAGNLDGVTWAMRFSDKYAHAYRNAADGLVPGTQFRERALTTRVGLNRDWGFSRLTLGYFHLTPGMTEGYEDDVLEGSTGYGIEIPFQQVRHYKAVWDNTFRVGEGRIKAIVGYQLNRRQEYEEDANQASLDFKLGTLNYDIKYISAEMEGWKISTGIGGMTQSSRNLGEEVLIPAYNLLDAGLFATASKALEKVHLSGGLRADVRSLHSFPLEGTFTEFKRVFPGVTGSIGLVYSPKQNLNIRANLARGFRAPNLSELASNGVHEGTVRYEQGNNALKPEFSLQGDLGADYANEHLSLSAAFFCNRIDNYIYAARTGSVIEGYDVYGYTAGKALLYGTELSADFHPIHQIHLGTQFSYVRGTFTESDMPLIPAPRLGADLRWEITHDGRTLNDSYLSFRLDHSFAQNHFLPGTETPTEAYTLLGVSAGTDILARGKKIASLCVIAENLTDAVYVDHLSRLKYVGLRNPGRNITVKLEIPLIFGGER